MEENQANREMTGSAKSAENKPLWERKTFLIPIGSLVVSFALHLSFLAPFFLAEVSDVDMKLEWMESFDDLQGLSTESGRWATLEKQVEAPPEEEPAEEPEPAPEPPEPKPKPKVEKKPKKIAKVVTNKEKKPKKKKEKTEKKPKKKTAEKKKSKIEYDRSGPSGLPNIAGYGPGNAVYSAMVRTDRIRGTVFQKPMTDLISGIPDYRIILQNTSIDPIRHVDMLYVASARPASISATFLAMKHRMTNGMIMQKLDRRFKEVPPWTNYRKKPMRDLLPENDVYQDPRKIFLARNGLALLGKEQWIKRLYRKDSRSESSMMTTLNKIQEANEDEQSLILVTARGLRLPIPGIGRQRFRAVKLEIANIQKPKVLIELGFKDAPQADAFARQCGRMKKSILSKMGPLRYVYGSLVERLTCENKEEYVVVNGAYSQKEILSLVNLISQFIPRPPMLDKLPEAGVSDLRKPIEVKKTQDGAPPSEEKKKSNPVEEKRAESPDVEKEKEANTDSKKELPEEKGEKKKEEKKDETKDKETKSDDEKKSEKAKPKESSKEEVKKKKPDEKNLDKAPKDK